MDRLLAHNPTFNKLRGRDDNGAGTTGLALNVKGEGTSVKGDFAFSSSGFRKSMAMRNETTISPAADVVMAQPSAGEVGFEFWAEGQFSFYERDLDGIDQDGNFAIAYTGVDFRMSDSLIVGVMGEVDWNEEDTDEVDGNVSGTGWMVGPYLSAELTEGLYFDARGQWGRSHNDADQDILGEKFEGNFNTERWLVEAMLSGTWNVGSFVIHPEISVAYIEENQNNYSVSDGTHTVDVSGQEMTLGRLAFGPEIVYPVESGDWILEPSIRLKVLWDFDGTGDVTLGGITSSPDEWRGLAGMGLKAINDSGMSANIAIDFDGIGASDFRAIAIKGGIGIPF
jgi:outer membrane autotransporter protein